MNPTDIAAFGASAPEGFRLEMNPDGSVTIHHRRTGMGCMNFFLMFWLAGWTVGCIILLGMFLNGGTMDDGKPIPLWFLLVFWVAEIIVACLLTYMIYCKKTFHLSPDQLTTETRVLSLHWRKHIPRHSIRKIIQVKDGGEGDDSFPSWGLKVEADKKITLIFRQPHEKSLWLGRVLAHWAGVGFSEVPES